MPPKQKIIGKTTNKENKENDAKRKAAVRSRESSAEREQRTAANRERMAAGRSRETSAERQQRTAADRERMAAHREMPPKRKIIGKTTNKENKENDAKRKAAVLSRESFAEREQRTAANRERMAAGWSRETSAERQQRTAADKELTTIIILPASYTGSPRYMHAHFQDAMTIVREFHKPDFFITFTCNPRWPEITGSLLPGQEPQDRPDIIARVFNQKLKLFMVEIKKDSILGRMCGFVYVVEFQKHGLPHVHILLILKADDRLRTAHDVDKAICAELFPDPDTFPEGPERDQALRLQEIVLKHMGHTCSNVCLDDNGKCKKGFPKPFCNTTQWDKNAFYPNYQRRSPAQGGRSIEHNGRLIDNSYIVPYNPYLALKYDGHINIESCVSPTAAKYLFLYVTKGSDRSIIAVDYDDEVTQFQNMRSIGACEACWRMFQFPITERYPAVMDLQIHLEGEEYTIFNEGEEEAVVNQGSKKTELTAFFQYNASNPETQVKYIDFPKHFTWNARNKTWKPRQRGFGGIIARIHTIHPCSGDEYYLRMLLIDDHCRGATSYANLRTVNGVLCDTFKEVCNRLGYLENDNPWHEALREAALH